jgi:competence protein ComEA
MHLDDDAPSRLEPVARWLRASPAELAGLAVLLLGTVVVTTLVWTSASDRPVPGDEWPHAVAPADGDGEAAAVGGQVAPHDGEPQEGDLPRAGDAGGHASADHTPADPADVVDPPDGADPPDVTVHVSGAVASPGLHTLPSGARVGDAVQAAGGADPDADPDRLNLARPLQDGEHVHLPRQGEPFPEGWAAPAGTGSATPAPGGEGADAGAPGAADGGLVDLNRASEAELEALPGIGPSKAAAIVRHREQHGPFATTGDVREVSGIGEKTFQNLADLVTVS